MIATPAGGWVLRKAVASDVTAIMAHEREIFPDDAWSVQTMGAELGNPHCYYLVATSADNPDRIDAYAGLMAPVGSTDADIQTIAVASAARRNGVGRALLTELIHEASRRGASGVFLEVRADNPSAQNLYESLGFTTIAVRPHYYQPAGVDATVMRLVLSDEKNGVE